MIRALKIRSRIQCAKLCNHLDEASNLEEVLENITLAIDALEINNDLKPFQILGFNAQLALTVTIATAAITFYSTLFTLYLHSGSLATVASGAAI
jgi:hypothetical protein